MIGAIAGDIIGSPYEHSPLKSTSFPLFSKDSRFTDDTVMTIAVGNAIMTGESYESSIKRFGLRYPHAGYGETFLQWLYGRIKGPYRSWGNGAAMRVSPVGFAFGSVDEVLVEAKKSAECTHNHPEGIKGAQATALAVFLSRSGEGKDGIRSEIIGRFGYDLQRTIDEIRPGYRFDVSCQGSVPESITAFLESQDYESAVRNAISLGGDSDTMGCIAGGIAYAFYRKIPSPVISEVVSRLPEEFLEVISGFEEMFCKG